ncbi:hypothetical protein ACIODS_12265 [Micromonospora chalcea]|uniref:hypothetical protein n=1 Tax=Micromonospora chalcea TaxID=1874 RepID=UPI0037FDBD6E
MDGSQRVVRLTLEVSNQGGEALPVVPSSREMTLLWGPNRQEADPVTGYSYDTPAEERRKALTVDGGSRVPAGGKATFVESGLVPVDGAGELAVVVDLPATDGLREPFTFTGVEKLVKTVR